MINNLSQELSRESNFSFTGKFARGIYAWNDSNLTIQTVYASGLKDHASR